MRTHECRSGRGGSAGRRALIQSMVNAVVTEVPLKLEPVTADSFEPLPENDGAREAILARIAELFGSDGPRRAIVD